MDAKKGPTQGPPRPPERRRFLRESLTGSLPLLVDWVTGQAKQIHRLAQEPTVPRRTSPPPEAGEAAPSSAKQNLDEHYTEFSRDNPDPKSFSS